MLSTSAICRTRNEVLIGTHRLSYEKGVGECASTPKPEKPHENENLSSALTFRQRLCLV